MERRFLTKRLWAATVVMIAVGAWGQGVLAEKPRAPDGSELVALVCDQNGIVVRDVTTSASGGALEVSEDAYMGRECFAVLRDAVSRGLVEDIKMQGAGDEALNTYLTYVGETNGGDCKC